jgi:S-adenosylhomocysteine hydrolase
VVTIKSVVANNRLLISLVSPVFTQMLHEKYPAMLKDIHGISEETTTGVHRLLEMLEEGSLV